MVLTPANLKAFICCTTLSKGSYSCIISVLCSKNAQRTASTAQTIQPNIYACVLTPRAYLYPLLTIIFIKLFLMFMFLEALFFQNLHHLHICVRRMTNPQDLCLHAGQFLLNVDRRLNINFGLQSKTAGVS